MFKMSYVELAGLGVDADTGAEFETPLLERWPARFRIVRLVRNGAEVERVMWLSIRAPGTRE